MKTVEIELFEFDELSESAKAKVLEKERDINVDYDWFRFTLDEWEQRLEAMGFENPDISFTGFWSQGDGASFTCKRVDVLAFLKALKSLGKFPATVKALKKEEMEFEASVDRIDHRYSHEYTVTASTDVRHWRFVEDAALYRKIEVEEGGIRSLILETVRTKSREIYRELEKENEYLTSDAQVIETIKSNEYTFRANGEMENL